VLGYLLILTVTPAEAFLTLGSEQRRLLLARIAAPRFRSGGRRWRL
jgi:hypothetical protein